MNRIPRLVTVGQLTADITVELDDALALGDQTTGAIRRQLGGSAAIAAHNAATLMLAPVVFSGHAGEDAAAEDGLATLRDAGVELGPLVRTETSPEVVLLVEPGGERTMVAAPGSPDWSQLELDAGPGDIVLFEGWHLFDRHDFAPLLGAARRSGAIVAVDVCSASRARDAAAHRRRLDALNPDILLANAAEAAAYGLEPATAGGLVLVHAGSEPTRIWHNGGCSVHDVRRRAAVDTSGAGDTFAGALLAALAAGAEVDAAVALAHEAAGRVVEVAGTLLTSLVPAAWR